LLCNLSEGERDEYWERVAQKIGKAFSKNRPRVNGGNGSKNPWRLRIMLAGGIICILLIIAGLVFPPTPIYRLETPWRADWSRLNCGPVVEGVIHVNNVCNAIVQDSRLARLQDFDLQVKAQFRSGESLEWISRLQNDGKSGYAFKVTRKDQIFTCEAWLVDKARRTVLEPRRCDDRSWEPPIQDDDVFLITARVKGSDLIVWLELSDFETHTHRTFNDYRGKLCREFLLSAGSDPRFVRGGAALLPSSTGSSATVSLWMLRQSDDPPDSCR